jgi:hypothetical protein
MFEIKPAEDQPDRVIAELLGVINNYASSVKRLESVVTEYQAMVYALREHGGVVVAQRDQARNIAAMLENECANCWGPIHQFAIKEARLQANYPYPTGEAADDGA